MTKTVADQFAEILAAAGVKRIYGIVGNSLNGLTDSLRRQGHRRSRGAAFQSCLHVLGRGPLRLPAHAALHRHQLQRF
jgi:hypothetical protein